MSLRFILIYLHITILLAEIQSFAACRLSSHFIFMNFPELFFLYYHSRRICSKKQKSVLYIFILEWLHFQKVITLVLTTVTNSTEVTIVISTPRFTNKGHIG